jgi:hypothetical protein
LQRETGLPDFSRHNIPKRGKYTKMTAKMPNGYKTYETALK